MVCFCSLAGTAACKTCSNNPYAETPPVVRTTTVITTDNILIVGRKTNADRIRSMTDEELADYLRWHNDLYSRNGMDWLDWLKQEVE